MALRHRPPSLPRVRVPYWGVVRCAVGKERWCRNNIRQAGGEAFFPRIRKDRSPLLIPLFPGYVFVKIEGAWGYLKTTTGVIQLLTHGERPACCRKELIDELIAEQGEDGYIDLSRPDYEPRPNENVRVHSGLFKDQIARYIAEAPENRIRLMIAMWGKEAEIELRKRDIGPA